MGNWWLVEEIIIIIIITFDGTEFTRSIVLWLFLGLDLESVGL
jgi:hypothetical protein